MIALPGFVDGLIPLNALVAVAGLVVFFGEAGASAVVFAASMAILGGAPISTRAGPFGMTCLFAALKTG